MHIGIDASRLAVGKRTGTENYAYQVIRGLLQVGAASDRFTLYFNNPPSPEILGKLDLSGNPELKSIPFPRLWTHLRLSREMLANPPETLFVPAHVLPLLHPNRSVVTLHDLGYLYFPEAHTPAQRRYLDWSTRYSSRAARQIIAISQATKNDLVRHYQIPPEKISVVYHGYDRALFQPVPEPQKIAAARVRYMIGSGPYLLYVGTIQPRKNLARFIEAFANLIGDATFDYAEKDHLQLILGGQRGWLSEPIVQSVEKLGLQKRVLLTGYLADEDLPALLSGAAAFVMPSLYEGFGMGLLEAMGCGCPVISSNAGSLPEVAGEAALLHHPLDTAAIAHQIRRLLITPGLAEQLRQKGFAQANRFSWERCATQTLAVLKGN